MAARCSGERRRRGRRGERRCLRCARRARRVSISSVSSGAGRASWRTGGRGMGRLCPCVGTASPETANRAGSVCECSRTRSPRTLAACLTRHGERRGRCGRLGRIAVRAGMPAPSESLCAEQSFRVWRRAWKKGKPDYLLDYHYLKRQRTRRGGILQVLYLVLFRWCGRGDSNPHDIATASPSSWCVCQFRHFRKWPGGEAGRKTKVAYYLASGAGVAGAAGVPAGATGA